MTDKNAFEPMNDHDLDTVRGGLVPGDGGCIPFPFPIPSPFPHPSDEPSIFDSYPF
jgi:hypothetical protein